ncbi:olfactory receptor OR9H1-like [Pelodiscus sinensis]|uniref:olfactory receptor OR9H1-like n=1 Tax=Pelodiscus sinensis TaxID=13735 RepID=UPI003F6D9060
MEPTKAQNHTALADFVLLGFGCGLEPKMGPFVAFLVIYAITVLGNVLLVFLIRVSSRLHTPMYFFLMNLSLLDLCYSSTIAPKAMATFLAGSQTISFHGCAIQFFFFGVFVTTETFLLAAMAYDRYSAICSPLLYPVAMSKRVCLQLLVGSYVCGIINTMVQATFTFTLRFCGSREIDHFFCDIPALLSLSCSNTATNKLVLFTLSSLILVSTSMVILVSYACVITTILQIRSTEGRQKAFSTCTSHMVAVGVFYGTLTFMYAQPSSFISLAHSKEVSVFYTLVIPMLNPLIYSLRNKDVKEALQRTFGSMMLK